MSNVVNWILDHRWAMMPNSLSAIIDIAQRNVTTGIDSSLFHKSDYNFDPKDRDVFRSSKHQALTNGQGTSLPGTMTAVKRGDVAIIPITGPIFPRSNLFTSMSGATSLQSISRDFDVAMKDPEIKSIILDIDSPGGAITDVEAFSDIVFEARKSKPVTAFISGIGASAAYWIASGASRIISANTGEVGSIGVVAAISDTKEKDKKEGIQNIEIVSSIAPQKRPDLTTSEGQAPIQKIVNDLGFIFAESIARNRGTDLKNVLENFGQGGVLLAKDALKSGMIDEIGTLESTIAQHNNTQQSTSGGSMPKLVTEASSADIKAENPGVYNTILEEGKQAGIQGVDVDAKMDKARKEGADKENARIKAIEGVSIPGAESIVAENKFDQTMSVESISTKIIQDQQAKLKAGGENIGKDAEDLAGKVNDAGSSQLDVTGSDDAEQKSALVSMTEGMK